MISSKQVELGKMLFDKLRHQFPEVELTTIRESPENPSHIWVGIVMPEDEDREIEIRELASEISTNILLQHGYHITISSAAGLEKSTA